jgi:hypothetical protein
VASLQVYQGDADANLSKTFAGPQRTSAARLENTEERSAGDEPDQQKTGCRAFVSREFWSKCAGASAARNLNRTLFMTDTQLKKLVNEAVSLHRALTTYNERLKALKADLIREAQRHKEDFTITDGGGSRWTACGTDGCIARVNFPAPALLSHIDTEDETFDKILALAGESLDSLFDSRHYLKPVTDFRDEVSAALPRRTAAQLIELCQVECSPRVSFETAETKTKER